MSCGSLPPVPDLIPISEFQINNNRKKHQHKQGFNNNRDQQECTPCAIHGEVMGEQRSRQTGKQPAIDLIDTSRSRGLSAAPQAPFRKTRPERHRKSERRREHRRGRKRSSSKQSARRSRTPSPETPVNPRVNPIFVWVRQEDTHIVEVKCEDYDKRNRILLKNTPHGWRAIPRTETMAPSLKEADDTTYPKHRIRKQRKTHKIKRRSTGIQVDDDVSETEATERPVSPPSWDDPVNVESHLPSHTIRISKSKLDSLVEPGARKLDVNKTSCDVSPLDNLLAVAELEFNHQLQSGEWDKCTDIEDKQKPDESDYMNNIDQLDKFIDSCANNESENILQNFDSMQQKPQEIDYNDDDDDDNNMDDILNRLEQSLRSPEISNHVSEILEDGLHQEEKYLYESKTEEEPPPSVDDASEVKPEDKSLNDDEIVEIPDDDITDDVPTDLSTKNNVIDSIDDQPTDLSLPKRKSPPPRPSSHGSETIQSPQPSGIPAVPPSPDIFLPSNQKSKSVFLESLLAQVSQKPTETAETTQEKEPLDLVNFRKSASPTVTCSEEVKNKVNNTEAEPPAKKIKLEDITLKRLLDLHVENRKLFSYQPETDTSKLLELLTSSCPLAPTEQLKKLLNDKSFILPDPLLVPKERLCHILEAPGKEIPRLLMEKPEIQLPHALADPKLIRNPDVLVLSLDQLKAIVEHQRYILPESSKFEEKSAVKELKSAKVDVQKPPTPKSTENKKEEKTKEKKASHVNELASDIDAATNAAFNQMLWLPYLNQLESNANHNNDFLKLLAMYSSQPPDMAHLLGMNRFMPPNTFPMQQPFHNPLEYQSWQEAMMQASMLRPKNQYDLFNQQKNMYRDLLEKSAGMNNKKPAQQHFSQKMHGKSNYPHNMYPPNIPAFQNPSNPLLNMPFPPASARTNLQVPQYNPIVTQQRGNRGRHCGNKSSTPRIDPYGMINRSEEKKSPHSAKPQDHHSNGRVHSKSYANFNGPEVSNKAPVDGVKHHHSGMQPIDLSGSTASGSKLKVRQHLIDPGYTTRLLKQDDVPEVGSTTASIEEMQDAQKYLWHPLFGNQKNYTSPWNWTTVTATGE